MIACCRDVIILSHLRIRQYGVIGIYCDKIGARLGRDWGEIGRNGGVKSMGVGMQSGAEKV